MRNYAGWIVAGGSVLLLVAGIVGARLYRQLTRSVQVEMATGPAAVVGTPLPTPRADTTAEIEALLLAAGLNAEPVLGDTAVSGHLQRLENGDVGADELRRYAEDLAYLNATTAEHGAQIPTDFWDVRTDEMVASGWNEYWVVRQTAVPEAAPYLKLLAEGYGRFRAFKDAEAGGGDTALDAALDMLALVETYYAAVAEAPPANDAAEVKGVADAKLLVWQSLVAGSTRINPLTDEPMFSHSIFARDNVGTMYQYELDREMGIAEVWGVSGFAPRFVGIPENNNQVEHMSISTVLQGVMGESVLVLDGIEEEKMLAGGASSDEAHADMALNNAIHAYFVPDYAVQGLAAVERLRCVLKSEQAAPDC